MGLLRSPDGSRTKVLVILNITGLMHDIKPPLLMPLLIIIIYYLRSLPPWNTNQTPCELFVLFIINYTSHIKFTLQSLQQCYHERKKKTHPKKKYMLTRHQRITQSSEVNTHHPIKHVKKRSFSKDDEKRRRVGAVTESSQCCAM